jgi:transposase-like protein
MSWAIRPGWGSGNSRNGYTPKTLATEAGTVDLEVPRDRNGSHEPKIVRKGQRRLDGIDKIVIGLYAHGMTVRDIQGHLADIYDIDVSPDLISKITDAVLEEVKEWQSWPLEPVWPVIFLDAIICKVRDGGSVKNKAAHLAVGVDLDGKKEVLGIWVEHSEGARFWLRVMNDLKARGIEDVLIVVCDGLTGLPAAVQTVWPEAIVQNLICSHWGWRDGPAGHPRRPGQDLCKPVAFEVQMQTCPAGVVAGLVSASGSSADLSAEMRFRRGRPCWGWRRLGGGHIRDVGPRSSLW